LDTSTTFRVPNALGVEVFNIELTEVEAGCGDKLVMAVEQPETPSNTIKGISDRVIIIRFYLKSYE
jgi:hypothetical protein